MNEDLINKIHLGDCLDIMPLIEDNSIDMIFCDLPYGTTNFKWDILIPFDKLWKQYNRIIKDNGIILLTAQQPFATDLINSNRKYFRYEWIWQKNQCLGFLNAKKMPLRGHELVLCFYKKLPFYNPQKSFIQQQSWSRVRKQSSARYEGYSGMKEKTQYEDTGHRYPSSVINISNWNGALFGKDVKSQVHGTHKPVDLIRYFLLTYSKIGDLVLDNCMGSGTTAEACILEGRNFIGCEMNEKFYHSSLSRISKVNKRIESQIFSPVQLQQNNLF